MKFDLIAVAALLAVLPGAVQAQTPVQTSWGVQSEPVYPKHICTTLQATLSSSKRSIDAIDADGRHTHPDHDRLQSAIDGCVEGAVKLVPGVSGQDGFLTSPLVLRSGVTLWVDRGVTLFASRDPADYDTGFGDCGTANHEGHNSCRPFLAGHDLVGAGIVGEGTIDARGGSRLLSGPNKGVSSWWDLAWLSKKGFNQHNFRMLQTDGGRNFLLYRITFENSPNFHLVPSGDGIVAWGIKIVTPSLEYTVPGYACPAGSTPDVNPSATCFTPDTVKNTDGFDPVQASHLVLAYSWISDGDDDVAIKAGGKLPSHDQVYAHNHFYFGHGMSLGSETDGGAQHILVTDLVMDGKDSPNGNGLRIKSDASRGGRVEDFVFEKICMRNEAHPLVFDTNYSDRTGAKYPDFSGVEVRDFHYFSGGRYGGGQVTFRGYEQGEIKHPLVIRLDNVVFDGVQPSITGGKGKMRPFATHFEFTARSASFADLIQPSVDDDVTIATAPSTISGAPYACDGAFIPLSTATTDAPI